MRIALEESALRRACVEENGRSKDDLALQTEPSCRLKELNFSRRKTRGRIAAQPNCRVKAASCAGLWLCLPCQRCDCRTGMLERQLLRQIHSIGRSAAGVCAAPRRAGLTGAHNAKGREVSSRGNAQRTDGAHFEAKRCVPSGQQMPLPSARRLRWRGEAYRHCVSALRQKTAGAAEKRA